jgi:hypothetical protein
MELSPSGGAANSAATQEFPSIYGTRSFIYNYIALHNIHFVYKHDIILITL